MLPHYVEKLLFFLSVLLFITGVESQGISGMTPSRTPCDRSYYCTPFQSCRYYINRPDSLAFAKNCSSRNGNVHRVCCPRNSKSIPVVRPVQTPQPEVRPEPGPVFPQNNECGRSSVGYIQTPYIWGGWNAKEGAWPWMVALTRRDLSGNYEPVCGGFLIDRKHVLTAAHCFSRKFRDWVRSQWYSTLIGSVDLKKSIPYSISNIIVHEGYRQGWYYNDIAVLTLSREVNLPNFSPICLPDQEIINRDLVGYGTTVAGWGSEGPGSKKMSSTLKELSAIPVVSLQECNRKLRRVESFYISFPNGINDNFICAGFRDEEKDTCVGDSGGPLMFQDRNKWFAVGLVSFGIPCGRTGIPSGYTKISSYLSWIKRNTKN